MFKNKYDKKSILIMEISIISLCVSIISISLSSFIFIDYRHSRSNKKSADVKRTKIIEKDTIEELNKLHRYIFDYRRDQRFVYDESMIKHNERLNKSEPDRAKLYDKGVEKTKIDELQTKESEIQQFAESIRNRINSNATYLQPQYRDIVSNTIDDYLKLLNLFNNNTKCHSYFDYNAYDHYNLKLTQSITKLNSLK